MIPYHVLEDGFKLEQVFELPFTYFVRDWDDQPLAANTAFFIGTSGVALYFALHCQKQPTCDLNLSAGDFVEELWRTEVAELFIAEQGSSLYFELNLAPTGAWWAQEFEDTRKPATPYSPRSVQTFSEIGEDAWAAGIKLPYEILPAFCRNLENCVLNSCAILGQEEQFLSWANIPLEKPDFHSPQHFETPQETSEDNSLINSPTSSSSG